MNEPSVVQTLLERAIDGIPAGSDLHEPAGAQRLPGTLIVAAGVVAVARS